MCFGRKAGHMGQRRSRRWFGLGALCEQNTMGWDGYGEWMVALEQTLCYCSFG